MDLVVKPFQYFPCELETFTINGKKANCMDFGDTYDHDEGIIEPVPLTSEILKRANINLDTYPYDKGITSNIKYVHELQHLLFGLILNNGNIK